MPETLKLNASDYDALIASEEQFRRGQRGKFLIVSLGFIVTGTAGLLGNAGTAQIMLGMFVTTGLGFGFAFVCDISSLHKRRAILRRNGANPRDYDHPIGYEKAGANRIIRADD